MIHLQSKNNDHLVPNTPLFTPGQHSESQVKCLLHTNFRVCLRDEKRGGKKIVCLYIEARKSFLFLPSQKEKEKLHSLGTWISDWNLTVYSLCLLILIFVFFILCLFVPYSWDVLFWSISSLLILSSLNPIS